MPHRAFPTPLRFSTIGIIGAGRLGSSFADALAANKMPVSGVAGRSARCAKASTLAKRLGINADAAQSVANQCDLIFIAVPDANIASVAAQTLWRPGQAVVHMSGATRVAALLPARQQGAHIGGFHPLKSVSQARGHAGSFQGITITLEAEYPPLMAHLSTIAKRLGSNIHHLPHCSRRRYHAAANHASALLISLLTDMRTLWASCGGSEQEMLAALLPVMKSTLQAVETYGIERALTGPLVRGDIATLEGHILALHALDSGLAQRYAAHHVPLISQAPAEQQPALATLLRRYQH